MPIIPTESHVPAAGAGGFQQGAVVDVGRVSGAKRLPQDPPFVFVHHPNKWIRAGSELLPKLDKKAIEPGIGNTDEYGNPALGLGLRANEGWVRIRAEHARAEDTPDGREGYLRSYPVRKGTLHLCAWEQVRPLGKRYLSKPATESYYAWLRALVERGVVRPPDPSIVEAMLDSATDRLDRASSRDLRIGMAARLHSVAKANHDALIEMAHGAPDG